MQIMADQQHGHAGCAAHLFDQPVKGRFAWLIEALRSLRMIHYAAWLARRWNDPAFPLAFPWFNTTRYWEDHVLSLREQLGEIHEPPLPWRAK